MRLCILMALFHSVAWTMAAVHDEHGYEADHANDDTLYHRHLQRLFGGVNATDGEFPFFGRAFINSETSEGRVATACGGSLIHEDIVMTVGCTVSEIRDPDVTSVTVQFNLGGNLKDGSDSTVYQVSDVVWPRNFGYPDNDIAFFKLSNSSSVTPVAWNTDPSIPAVGDVGTVIGFGFTTIEGPTSPFLLKLDLPIISASECRSLTRIGGFTLIEPTKMVCAYTPGKSTCNGDSGGPILTPSGVVYGMDSFVSDGVCGSGASVFTRVSAYSDMIESVSRALIKMLDAHCDTSERWRFAFFMNKRKRVVWL
jgi:secreted trypsin-like serine protease